MHEPGTPAMWAHVKALFLEARELPASQRAGWLDAHALDAPTRAEVDRLLRADEAVGNRFEQGALANLPAAAESTAGGMAAGRRLGAYRVVRRIGEGGMGTVYEAERDGEYKQRVALKTVWRDVDSAVLAQRLRSERQILAGLRHPNIAALLDGGSTPDGLPYLVMEFVDGAPLDAWCDARALSLPARLDLFQQVCAAVAHAHRNLVVHRDLKPSNVIVTPDGTVKLLDFGVAKLVDGEARPGTLTGAGLSPFTAAFAAPEQVMRTSVTTATDVYALGALLHLLLVGRGPLAVEDVSPVEAVLLVRDGPRTVPSEVAVPPAVALARGGLTPERLRRAVTGELDAIVRQALQVDPLRRYPTVDALLDDVQRYLRGDRVTAKADTLWYRLRTVARRRPAAATAAAAALVLVVAGGVGSAWTARQIRAEAARAEAVTNFLSAMLGAGVTSDVSALGTLGPRATMAEVVDSAAHLVPIRFATDAAIRARLYTALGASYAKQGRTGRAIALLDSARLLARGAEGEASVAYLAATLEASAAALSRDPPRVGRALADSAWRLLEESRPTDDWLRQRALLVLARASIQAGQMVAAESLAAAARALESPARRSRSLARLSVLQLAAYRSYHAGDLTSEVRLAREAMALADSIGGARSLLYFEPSFTLISARAQLGDTAGLNADVDQFLQAGVSAYGAGSREHAVALAVRALVRAVTGPPVAGLPDADSAWVMVQGLPDIDASSYADVVFILSNLAAGAGWRWYADSVLETGLRTVLPRETPYATVATLTTLGISRSNTGRPAEAEALLRQAIAISDSSDYLRGAVQWNARVQLSRVLVRAGRRPAADSILAPVPAAIADAARAQWPPAAPARPAPPDPPRVWRANR